MKQVNAQIHTELNRYPFLFGNMYYLRDKYKDGTVRILSFGCSTGEELVTLQSYFPRDHIYGCDINIHALDQARILESDRITVFESSRDNIERYGPFDIIFANSVLCINAHNERLLKEKLPFERFETLIVLLARVLSNNGILAIYNPSYFADDSGLFRDLLMPIRSHFVPMGYVPRYDVDSKLVLERKTFGGRGYYKLRNNDHPIPFEKFVNVMYTNSHVIASETLDYSKFDLWQTPIAKPYELVNQVESQNLLWQYSIWHYKLDEEKIDKNISSSNVSQIGNLYMPQLFYKIPGCSSGFKSLNAY